MIGRKAFIPIVLWGVLLALCFTTLSLQGSALRKTSNLSARAEESVVPEMILPASTEEYLEITQITAIYTDELRNAYADGATVLVFDKNAQVYRTYTAEGAVRRIAFDGNGFLWYRTEDSALYKMDLTDGTSAAQGVSCTSFAIDGNVIYYAVRESTSASVYYAALSAPKIAERLEIVYTNSDPVVCYADALYYSVDGKVYKYDRLSSTYFMKNITGAVITDFTVSDGFIWYTDGTEALSYQDFNGDSAGRYTTRRAQLVAAFQGKIHVASDDRVYRFDPTVSAYDSFVIASAASAQNRLSGAKDFACVGNLLVIADTGNSAVCVFDPESGESRKVVTNISPALVAATPDCILVSDGRMLSLMDYNGKVLCNPVETSGIVNDIVPCATGFYVLTDGKNLSYLSAGGTLSLPLLTQSAVALASDVHANVYLVAQNGKVYLYENGTLSEFYDFAVPIRAALVDFSGRVFAVTESGIVEEDGTQHLPDVSPFGSEAEICKVVLSDTRQVVYVLYGNYVVKLPVSVATQAKESFGSGVSQTQTAPKQVEVRKNAPCYYVDFALYQKDFIAKSATYAEQTFSALVLAENEDFYLLSARKGDRAMLVHKNFCANESYLAQSASESYYVAYDTDLFMLPDFTLASEVGKVQKGALLRIVGIVEYADGQKFGLAETAEGTLGYVSFGALTKVSGAEKDVQSGFRAYYTPASPVVLTAADGTPCTVSERIQVTVWKNGEGEYEVAANIHGVTYFGVATEAEISDYRSTTSLRTMLTIGVITLIFVAVVYFFFFKNKI